MLKPILIVGALVFAVASASAQTKATTKGASTLTPGHQMQNAEKKGLPSTGPGASEYAPGHLAKQKGATSTGPGASEFAPGQVRKNPPTTTGSGNRMSK